jgi:hypothetical protein
MPEDRVTRKVRRACTNKDMRKLLLNVIKAGARCKVTKSGVMFLGADGAGIAAHMTVSDRRGVDNFRAELRNIGITEEGAT